MKKIFLSLLISLLFLTQGVNAQKEKGTLTYKQFMKLDKSWKGALSSYFFWWIYGDYTSNPEFTPDVDRLFDFKDDDWRYIPLRVQKVFQNNKQSFQFEMTDSSLTAYYDGEFILSLLNVGFTCEMISEVSDYRSRVWVFDEKGNSFWDEQLMESFQERRIEIYKKYWNESYETIFFPYDTIYIAASERPLVIAYQYSKETELSIHKFCSCKHELLQNPYVQDLTALADEYCDKYNLSRIIFAARVVRNREE